jgi:predicted nucleic acid-binding protein
LGLSRIFWDTNLFIYLLEATGEPFQLVQRVLVRMHERRDTLITSALTLGELHVKPLERRHGATEPYERFFNSQGIQIISFGREAARAYGRIRQDRSIRPPDAIQLACAATAETNLFVTNDARLSRKVVRGVDFIVPLDQVFL